MLIESNRESQTQVVSAAGADCRIKVNINKAHELLGHTNEDATCAAAKGIMMVNYERINETL